MKRFVLLIGVLIAALVAAGCSGGEGSGGSSQISAPSNPVPDYVHDAGGNPGAVDSLSIQSNSTVTTLGGSIALSVLFPPHLLGADVTWSLSGGFGDNGSLTNASGPTTTWNAPNSYGLSKTIKAVATLGDTTEEATIKVTVTKGLAPKITGPNHVGFFNPPTFSVSMQASYRADATVSWAIEPSNGTLTPNPATHSVIWEPSPWRSDFYTITATIQHPDEDHDISISHTFTTSFCSQGRTNTPANPCGIENIHQLAAIHYFLDGHFVLLNDIDASETKDWNTQPGTGRYGFWPLGADATQDPLPLGSPRRIETTNFTGSFDGGKHTISNLHIVWPGSIGVGLFGFVHKDAVIKDVYLSKATVVGYEFVGGIAGRLEGTVTGSSVTDSTISYAGHGRTCTSQPNFHQGDRVGGLVGLVSSGGGAVGDSYALRTDVSGCAWVGGLAGIVGGVVTDSYSMGGIVNSPIATWRGGFTGQVSSNGKVSRTFALMGDNVAYTGLASNGAIIEQSYWSSDYPEAANQSLYAEDIPVAQFSQIIDNLDAAWELKNDGPGAFMTVPNLVHNSR